MTTRESWKLTQDETLSTAIHDRDRAIAALSAGTAGIGEARFWFARSTYYGRQYARGWK